MYRFSRAIVRRPGRSLIAGITEANQGIPDYGNALKQHREYINALVHCGLIVETLDAVEAFPDSVFIEDIAVMTPHCAIITRPGAPARSGEIEGMRTVLGSYRQEIEDIKAPGTLEGGDVMQINSHYYIGLSARTNRAGAEQLITILEKYGMSGSTVSLSEFLHLKTGVTSVAENTLIAAGEFVDKNEFTSFKILKTGESENEAANCIRINDYILMPAGCPEAYQLLSSQGVKVIEIDISEFAKLDGGLTCLSLRF
jgi:dimethylargininase